MLVKLSALVHSTIVVVFTPSLIIKYYVITHIEKYIPPTPKNCLTFAVCGNKGNKHIVNKF